MVNKANMIEHPITGERIEFAEIPTDTDSEPLELKVWAKPKPRDFVAEDHVHPKQVEYFHIISGTCHYRMDGVERRAKAGDEVKIPQGTPHVWWNADKDELHLYVKLQPACKTKELLETFCGFGQDQRAHPKTGRPKGLLQMAVMLHEFREELQLVRPVYFVPGRVFKVLATAGRLLGYMPQCPYVYDRMAQAQTCRYVLDNGKQCDKAAREGERYCPKHTTNYGDDLEANDLEVYKVVTDKFNNELNMFWTRANFYLLVQAGLFSVAVSLLKRNSTFFDRLLVEGMCLVGVSLAVLWFLVLRGSVYWIEEWRKLVVTLDKAVDRFNALSAREDRELKNIWRPAYVTKYLPWIFTVAWVLLAIWTLLGGMMLVLPLK